MMGRRMSLAFFPALLLALVSCARKPIEQAAFDPSTYTELTFNDSDSMDPAWSYDTASDEVILNVYEPLFIFKGASTKELIPLIAAKVPTRANGLISADGRTYTIPIRRNVTFQDGTPMTMQDVRYSVLRFMLQDRDAGPSPLLLEPLTGYGGTRDAKGKIVPGIFKRAEQSVQIDGWNLVLRLPRPFSPLPTILASWAPIVSKKWATEHGDWDGSEATWKKYNNPEKQTSYFFEHAFGTGPFVLVRWDRNTHEIVLRRNDHYWRAPAKLKYVIIKGIDEFETRKLMIQAGQADSIYATRDVWEQVQNIPHVDIVDNLSTLEINPIVFFTFKLNGTANPYIGSGKLDGNGIPLDFFNDVNVRKAFAYAFDYKGYINDVVNNKGIQPTGVVPKGLLGYNPSQKKYHHDPQKAAYYFKKAFGGRVWKKGFKFTAVYNAGNIMRQSLLQVLKHNVEALNPRFNIEIRPIDWPEFLDAYIASKLPIFILAWQADYPDAYDFAFPMLDSQGAYPGPQHFADPRIDKLIDEAVAQTNPAAREKLYWRIQELEYQDVPDLPVLQPLDYRTQRDWVKGWVNNPIFPDAPYGCYYYPVYKQLPVSTQKPAAKAPKHA
ncbi:MAG: ABC transporter substrate-binding protein [Elusimicrobia bacterium]|nr:ABC transporter substrate-binding protein [Elusimicrobiota bacterium]